MHGSKLNQEATKSYSQSYSVKIIEDFFSQNDVITGQQIISVTPVKQVNFFVLKALFDEWQGEIKKFKSPFFNYKNEDVNHALKTLVNTLSKNIQIQKEHFKPLLERAVTATLLLMYEPARYYMQELGKTSGTDKARELRASSKYIKIYKPLAEDIVSLLDKDQEVSLAIESAVSGFADSAHELKNAELLFNETLQLNVAEKPAEPEELAMPKPLADLEGISEMELTEEVEDINSQFEPVNEHAAEDEAESVNKQYKEEVKTLNESFKKKEKAKSLAAVHESKSLSNLKNNININQRYMFVNDLFDGNEADYENAMDEVENCDSFDSSVELLVQSYARKYDWDMNADEVKELLKVIFKRFR